MTSCIGMGMSEWRVMPDYFPGEQRARLNLGSPNLRFTNPWSVYDVRQVDGGTEVTWRRIPMIANVGGGEPGAGSRRPLRPAGVGGS